MEKVLFKFSTIQKPSNNSSIQQLINNPNDSEIITAIITHQSITKIQEEIFRAIRNISEYTYSDMYKKLIVFYNILDIATKNEKTIQRDKFEEIFMQVFSSTSYAGIRNEFAELKKSYSNLLTAIKLSSNSTRVEDSDDFINILKAWSTISMYENANDSSEIKWIDVFSTTFVIPINKANVPQLIENDRSFSNNKNKDVRQYNQLVSKYKNTIKNINQFSEIIAEIKDIEKFDNLKKEDLNNPRILNDLISSKFFRSLFKESQFQSLKLDIISSNTSEAENLVIGVRSTINTKTNRIINSLQKLTPDLGINESDIKSGIALNKLLNKIATIKKTRDDIREDSKNKFSIDLEQLKPDELVPIFDRQPFHPLLPDTHKSTVEDRLEPIFELLVSNLILVKEKNVGYIASDIAHIETAMEGEMRSKEHRTLDRTERRLTTAETTEVKQHLNLATNSQTNYHSEIEKAQKKKLGGEVTAGYNGASFKVDVKAYYDNETKNLDQTVRETAEDITEEARIEVTRKIHKERSEISINEVEIINKHQIENNFGNGHLNGIYQWVDQVKEFNTVEYGKHMIIKLILPDPAKLFFIQKKEENSTKELEFPLAHPSEIQTIYTAFEIGKKYGVSDFETPPVAKKYITKVIEYSGKDTEAQIANYLLFNEMIPISEEGYEVSRVTVQYRCPWIKPDGSDRKQLEISALGSSFSISSDGSRFNITEKNGMVGMGILNDIYDEKHSYGQIQFYFFRGNTTLGIKEVPIAVMTRNNNYFQATVTVELDGHDYNLEEASAYSDWQKRIYNQLYQAYLSKNEEVKRNDRNDREDRLLSVISGKNPLKNKQIIFEEFKRQIIGVLSEVRNHTFKGFFSSTPEIYNIPIDQMRQYSKYIDFFENAIDWNKMSYILYPYYWHEHNQWFERQKYEDPDPLFESFMKSGAAETFIPIKRGFERKFIHYIELGELWNNNSPLSITSEENAALLSQFNNIETEIESKRGKFPWRVRIPTNLILLSEKNKLDEISPLNQDEDNG